MEPGPKEDRETLNTHALVELFGHARIVGRVSEQSFGNGVLFRVDVPDLIKDGRVVRNGFTRYLGIGAIYSITPITAEAVRELLPAIDGTPAARPLSLKSYGARAYDNDDDGQIF